MQLKKACATGSNIQTLKHLTTSRVFQKHRMLISKMLKLEIEVSADLAIDVFTSINSWKDFKK
jgi:hypothetical protein